MISEAVIIGNTKWPSTAKHTYTSNVIMERGGGGGWGRRGGRDSPFSVFVLAKIVYYQYSGLPFWNYCESMLSNFGWDTQFPTQ